MSLAVLLISDVFSILGPRPRPRTLATRPLAHLRAAGDLCVLVVVFKRLNASNMHFMY